jgi:hypothetical protein
MLIPSVIGVTYYLAFSPLPKGAFLQMMSSVQQGGAALK